MNEKYIRPGGIYRWHQQVPRRDFGVVQVIRRDAGGRYFSVVGPTAMDTPYNFASALDIHRATSLEMQAFLHTQYHGRRVDRWRAVYDPDPPRR